MTWDEDGELSSQQRWILLVGSLLVTVALLAWRPSLWAAVVAGAGFLQGLLASRFMDPETRPNDTPLAAMTRLLFLSPFASVPLLIALTPASISPALLAGLGSWMIGCHGAMALRELSRR